MAATQFKRGSVNNALIPEQWSKDDFKFAFNANPLSPFIGSGDDSVIQIIAGTEKMRGDKVTWALRGLDDSTGQGDDGDYEGNEGSMTFYEDSIQLHERGHSQKLNGKMTEKSAYDHLRPKGKQTLAEWTGRTQAADMVGALSGMPTTTIMGKITGERAIATGSTNVYIETVNEVGITKGATALRSFIGGQTSAGVLSRVANHSSVTSAANCLMGTKVIDYVRRMAKRDYYINASGVAIPVSPLRPIMVNGSPYYLLFINELQLKSLRAETAFLNALTYADNRGGDNKLFKAVDYVWNNVLIKVTDLLHMRTGTSATSDWGTGEYFEGSGSQGAATSADACASSVTVARSLFCGAQAGGLAWGQRPVWSSGYGDAPHNTKYIVHTDMIYAVKKAAFATGAAGANVDFGCNTNKMTKTDIYNRVVKRTGRTDLEDIDEYLIDALYELSLRTGAIKASVAGTIATSNLHDSVSGVYTIDKPSDYIDASMVFVDNEELDPLPLSQVLAGCYGYGWDDEKIYFAGIDNGKSYDIKYQAYHPEDVTTIMFTDIYKSAIIYLCCQKVYEDYEIEDKTEFMRQRYENALLILPADMFFTVTRRS